VTNVLRFMSVSRAWGAFISLAPFDETARDTSLTRNNKHIRPFGTTNQHQLNRNAQQHHGGRF
jgi:hypothetical protein